MKGFEADDLIATYARMAVESGLAVTIISSDKDLMQLVDDAHDVRLMDPVKNTHVHAAEVAEKFGVPPHLVIDAQALIGDTADNVPGAPGIGVKTAAQLLMEYGDLDKLLARAHEIPQPKRREALTDFKAQILLSRDLVRLRLDVPPPFGIADFVLKEPDSDTLQDFLGRMEFAQLAKRVGGTLRSMEVAKSSGAPRPVASSGLPSDVTLPVDYSAYHCFTEADALKAWIAAYANAEVVAVDTETDSLSSTASKLVGVSLAFAPNIACYIPLGHEADDGLALSGETRTQIPMEAALEILRPLLTNPAVLKVGQNLKYDLSVFKRYGLEVAPIDDTILISYVLEGGLHGHGMDELSELHLGHKPISFKDVAGSGKAQKSFKYVEYKPATDYAAEDADITLRLWQVLKPRLLKSGRLSVYETLERAMPKILSDMELEGVRVDPEALRALSRDFGNRMLEIEKEAYVVAGRSFNLNSPQQLGLIFFDEMKLEGGKKTATGQWATDVKVLEDLAERGVPLARLLIDYRQMAKLKGTYTDALPEHADPQTHRIHTSYALASTTTGRLSSNDPNLQNIPIRTAEGRKIRTAFIAKPGCKLISADYSQIELRLLAHIGDIAQLKKAFSEGLDIHAMTASEMFSVPLAEMTSEIRRRAKAINFGIIYGISAFGLAAQLGIDNSEAGRYIKTYFERFPGIKAYMDTTKAFVRENGYVETLFGRRIHIPESQAKSGAHRAFAERAAINAPIQGAAADIIRRAMIRMPSALKDGGFDTKMLLQVHDELIFEAPEGEIATVMPLIVKVMETAHLPAVDISVPLTVEAHAANNWDEAH